MIAGLPPIDLVIEERMARWMDKNDGMEVGESRRIRRRELLEEWQRRWEVSDKGRETFDYFPDVRERMRKQLVVANHYSTHFLSGHGNFGAKLYGFGLKEDRECNLCGVLEFAEHVIFECPRYMEERYDMLQTLDSMGLYFEKRNCVWTGELFQRFVQMATRIRRRREEVDSDEVERGLDE